MKSIMILNDPDNFGCQLRDGIYANYNAIKKAHGTITAAVDKIEIPKEHWGDIIAMCEYRRYERLKDRVEELLHSRICYFIVRELKEQEYKLKQAA